MKCSQIQSTLSEYLDGGLNPVQASQVREHLDCCHNCEAHWRALRQTVRLVAHLGHEKCPVDLRASVALAVQGTPSRAHRRLPFLNFALVSGGGTALATAAVLAALVLVRPHTGASPLPKVADVQTAAAAELPVHDQGNSSIGLGSTDGILISLPPHGASPLGQNEHALAN